MVRASADSKAPCTGTHSLCMQLKAGRHSRLYRKGQMYTGLGMAMGVSEQHRGIPAVMSMGSSIIRSTSGACKSWPLRLTHKSGNTPFSLVKPSLVAWMFRRPPTGYHGSACQGQCPYWQHTVTSYIPRLGCCLSGCSASCIALPDVMRNMGRKASRE